MITMYPVSGESIDYTHHKVHEGKFFSGAYYNSSVANGATIEILIQVGSTSTFHMKFAATAGGDSTVQLYEGTTFSAAGTAVTMSNHNRASANSFSGTITHTPTLTLAGTQINGTGYVTGGDKHTGSGGEFGFNNEFVLSKSTNYLLRLTNNSGSAVKACLAVEGYQPSL